MTYLYLGVIIIIIIILTQYQRELFGESIYTDPTTIRGDSTKRPAIYSAGATMRNLGTLFSMTNQSMDRNY
jgi:hypothetical protein